MKHVVRAQRITHHTHRQTPDELSLESVVDEVLRACFSEEMLRSGGFRVRGDKADGFPVRALFNELFQTAKSTADNEEDVACVHHLAARAALAGVEHHLHLAADIVWRVEGHFRLLHQL